MKRLPLFTAIIIGLVILIMFLPYITASLSESSYNYSFSPPYEIVSLKGIEFVEVYFLLLGFIVIAIVSTIKRNLTTALISFILTFGLGILFLSNIVLIVDKPTYYFREFEWGFILHGLLVFIYFIMLLINLAVEFTKKKKNRPASSSELLDDF